jgi:hypothetical protein
MDEGDDKENEGESGTLCPSILPEKYKTSPIFPEENRWAFQQNTRSDSTTSSYPGGRSQDYIGLAHIYKIQRPYSLSTAKKMKCVLCHSNETSDVFFPCEHRCVCRPCIKTENILTDSQFMLNSDGYCNCPLCATIIKKILPHDGHEVEVYWKWVHEISPPLPAGFLRNFKHSAGVIETVHVNGKSDTNFDNSTGLCTLS